ncbi:MAG TPA: LuxR C-terminal-related transcriptional regulator [Rugosimonospora sp.]|nr:LuxR C-terminal-related transcriptional regulator [Rugosimonospora sp.]
MFEALGLSGLTESVYLALLDHPDASIDDLSALLDLPTDEIRRRLDELARMSLLQRSRSDSGAFRPIDPKVGLEALAARRAQEIEASKAAFELFLAERSSQPKGIEPPGDVLYGVDTIRARLRDLARSCEWEACSLMPGGAQSVESMEASTALDAEAIDRGVRLRTVYLDSIRGDPATQEYASRLQGLGSEVRTAPTLPLRLLIVDRKVAVVPVSADNSGTAAVVVTTDGVVTALLALFNAVWRTAVPLGTAKPRDEVGLSLRERHVLQLLAEGRTDEMIARRLGVSVRTARRIASDLLDRLGASSRFAAGAKAAMRGWLEVDDLP